MIGIRARVHQNLLQFRMVLYHCIALSLGLSVSFYGCSGLSDFPAGTPRKGNTHAHSPTYRVSSPHLSAEPLQSKTSYIRERNSSRLALFSWHAITIIVCLAHNRRIIVTASKMRFCFPLPALSSSSLIIPILIVGSILRLNV